MNPRKAARFCRTRGNPTIYRTLIIRFSPPFHSGPLLGIQRESASWSHVQEQPASVSRFREHIGRGKSGNEQRKKCEATTTRDEDRISDQHDVQAISAAEKITPEGAYAVRVSVRYSERTKRTGARPPDARHQLKLMLRRRTSRRVAKSQLARNTARANSPRRQKSGRVVYRGLVSIPNPTCQKNNRHASATFSY